MKAPLSSSRAGLLFAIAAYGLWGFLPAYFLLLKPAGPFEVVAFRILMSLVFCAILLTVTRGWPRFRELLRDRRTLLLMACAAVAIYLNWQAYVIAALEGHVIEASLGYFINPIVTVLLGVLVLREKVRLPQWIALGIAFVAILVIAIGYGAVPWIALVLAFSFGAYGLIKRVVGPTVDAVGGLTLETALLAPLAVVQLVLVATIGGGIEFGQQRSRPHDRDALRGRGDHRAAAAVRGGRASHPAGRARNDPVPRARAAVPLRVAVPARSDAARALDRVRARVGRPRRADGRHDRQRRGRRVAPPSSRSERRVGFTRTCREGARMPRPLEPRRPRAALSRRPRHSRGLLGRRAHPDADADRVTPTPTGDGELKIGTLFPSSGGVAFIGPAQVAGVNAALREINAAGGVNGKPVVVVNRDSGDATTQKAEESFADLVAQGVDVVIGPSSSVLAQRLLEPAADADIPLISPAATYPQLTVLDEAGYFFRTIPSYPHQAIVLADIFARRDVASVAVVFRDDDLGTTLSTALEEALEPLEIDLESVEVAADADAEALAAAVADVKEAEPDVVVLATPDNGDQTKALITQLIAAGFGGAKLWLTSQNLADYSQALPAGLAGGRQRHHRGRRSGCRLPGEDQAGRPGRRSTSGTPRRPTTRPSWLRSPPNSPATTAASRSRGCCVPRRSTASSARVSASAPSVFRTEPDIDYDGVSGSTNLDENGDPARGTYVIVAYNGENKYARQSSRVG